MKIDESYLLEEIKHWPESIIEKVKFVCTVDDGKRVGDRGEAIQSNFVVVKKDATHKKTPLRRTHLGCIGPIQKVIAI